MLASSISKNDYSLYEFALRKFDNSLEIQVSYNLDLFEHYINTKRIGKNEGILLVNEKQFINKINKPGFYRFTPHLIENDTNNFFASKFTSGLHLYKNDPKEIWDAKMGVASAKNAFTMPTKSFIQTTVDEKENHISVTDNYAGLDGRSWLSSNSHFGPVEDDSINFLPELINSRPTSGAPDLNQYICEGCKKFEKFTKITDCWKLDYPDDIIQSNENGGGDHMAAIHKDSEKLGEKNWEADNTEYFRLDERNVSWGDEYEEITVPTKDGNGNLNWHGYDGTVYNSRVEAISSRTDRKNYSSPLDLLGGFVSSTLEVKKAKNYSSRVSDGEIKSRGQKVSRSEYESKSSNPDWDTYAHITKESKSTKVTETEYRRVEGIKGTKAEEYQNTYDKEITSAEYDYYVLKRSSKDIYYVESKHKKLVKKAGSNVETDWVSLGKGQSAKEQYDKLPQNKRDKKPPKNPFLGVGKNIPSWKFNASKSWSSAVQGKKIKLIKGKIYKAELNAFEVIKGEGKAVKTFKHDQRTDDGRDWEAWLEQGGGTWTIQFSHLCLTSDVIGNTEGLDGGMEMIDMMESFEDVKSEDFGQALDEGINKIESEKLKEQELTLEQLQEALHLSEEQIAQEYTLEQVRQIQAEQIRQAQQQKQTEKTTEEDEENWEEFDKRKHRNRKR